MRVLQSNWLENQVIYRQEQHTNKLQSVLVFTGRLVWGTKYPSSGEQTPNFVCIVQKTYSITLFPPPITP